MNSTHWLRYFETNRLSRAEPDWNVPSPDDRSTRRALARSLSHFQLGESGEGAFLLAQARQFAAETGDPDYYTALALFIKEEQEHARLLGRLVVRAGGRLALRHWTHSLFRLFRRALGLNFELQVLVIAELVGTAYYRILRARSRDPVIESVCDLILRDEIRHIAFHAERLASWHGLLLPVERSGWVLQFQVLFCGATAVAWMDHRRCLRALGSTRAEFLRLARQECIQFLDQLQAHGVRNASPNPLPHGVA